MPEPLSIGFNVPFFEAIQIAAKRGVVLPQVYYGQLQGVARQKAFSIAGITSLDQLQAVKDSLDKAILEGRSFNQWKKEQAVLDLGLPKHRLDNIYRTNLQTSYMAGKWEQFNSPSNIRRYLMYDAINDSRVRPAHLALDGIIRPIGDAFWGSHSPPCGYRCRCSLISLDDKQAKARSVNGKGLNQQPVLANGLPANPDVGWDYDKTNRMAGIEKAIEQRKTGASTWFQRTLLEQMEKKIAQNAKVIESSTIEKTIESKTMEQKNAQDLLSKLIANAEKATGENKLFEMWSNPKKYKKHIEKRLDEGVINNEQDYQNKTFSVFAKAEKITIAQSLKSDMISGKMQVLVDDWIVLLGTNGQIVTSYKFDPIAETFEEKHTKFGDTVYEQSIDSKTRELLKKLFDAP